MNGRVILNCLAVLIWGDQVIKFLSIFASPKKILYRNQSLGAPALWAFWAQVKYPFKDLLPKEPKVWDSEVSPEVERSRNYGTEMNHRCGEVSSLSPRLCPHLAPHTTSTRLLRRLYSHIEYFMESAGVPCIFVRVADILPEIERVRSLIQKQRSRKYRAKHFPCGIVFVRYRDVHHWFC